MRNKRLLRTLSALCLTLVLASGFTVPAFAQGAAPPPAEDTTNDSNVVVEETEKAPPLTPEGNAALVDDFGGNKQLITVMNSTPFVRQYDIMFNRWGDFNAKGSTKQTIHAGIQEAGRGNHDERKDELQRNGSTI